MADYNSSLPVRTQNNGDVVAQLVDGTVTTQKLTINADGSLNVTDNAGSLTVDGTVELGATTLAALESITVQNGSGGAAVNIQDGGNSITVDGTVELGATSLAALESITVQNGSGAGAVNIQDGGNSITVDGTVTVSNLPATVDTNYGTAGASTIRTASQIGNATGGANFNNGATGAQTLRVAANLAIAGADVTSSNPIPVIITDATPGTAISDYNTSSALAAAASNTHTYTSTGNFNLTQIFATASGKMKIVVSVNAVVKFAAFNSTANPNINITLDQPILATTGQTVTIARTNNDLAAQDVYSTVIGYNA